MMTNNFEIPETELPKDPPQTGQSLKNIKEMKFSNGSVYTDASGKMEWRDSHGNVVIRIDPNG